MYEVSQAFIDAINNENIQHIQATIKQVDGTERVLDDEELFDNIVISKQCTEDAETFCFGQMYVGTAEIILNMSGISTNRFKGGELSMDFGVDITGSEEPEWIPLGIWDISETTRETGDRIRIRTTVVDIYDKKGGALEFVVAETTSHNQAGELCVTARTVTVVRH